MLPPGFTEEGRRGAVRAAGRGAFDEVLPVLIRSTMWRAVPVEHVGDGLLAIHRDWDAFKARSVVALFIRLEILNAEIMEEHRRILQGPTPQAGPAPRPTRRGKKKTRRRTR